MEGEQESSQPSLEDDDRSTGKVELVCERRWWRKDEDACLPPTLRAAFDRCRGEHAAGAHLVHGTWTSSHDKDWLATAFGSGEFLAGAAPAKGSQIWSEPSLRPQVMIRQPEGADGAMSRQARWPRWSEEGEAAPRSREEMVAVRSRES
ncbi:hypothetical protein E2562_021170 [Oryza meyeriana var. granulata]|uniref:Uncharacterized protein n=1 Tax=Oryza meyeriana var. granulata TaxID=110450 RepID=A0A6G1DZ34_9ORYZ|nr:hypothetical protein E2562_021170 [Oryza meyeriana var. granulata]